MTESAVPDKLTPCSPPDLYAALRASWQKLMPSEPCLRSSLLVLLAHWALETGFGHFCHNFNLGNIKHIAGDGHDYTMVRLNEVVGGKVVWYDPPDPATWLRAYSDLESACVDYLCRLRAEFRIAWPYVDSGDVVGFCHALKLANYYTADEALYTSSVQRCYRQLDAAIPPDAIVTDPALPEDQEPANPVDSEPHS